MHCWSIYPCGIDCIDCWYELEHTSYTQDCLRSEFEMNQATTNGGGRFMRRLILLVLLMMALPMAAFAAKQVDMGNNAGTLTGTDAGLTVPDSILTSVNNLYGSGLITGNLGI